MLSKFVSNVVDENIAKVASLYDVFKYSLFMELNLNLHSDFLRSLAYLASMEPNC